MTVFLKASELQDLIDNDTIDVTKTYRTTDTAETYLPCGNTLKRDLNSQIYPEACRPPNIDGAVSHFVGFYMLDNKIVMDTHTISNGDEFVIDINKYNLRFTDGTPSWRILEEAFTIEFIEDLVINIVKE